MPMISTRDGTRLYVKDWGSGRPVVLLHGWSLSADYWDYQSLALANAGYRAISYDRRGFGRSDQPWLGYDYDTFCDDLFDVMKALSADQDATLVGFSMGTGEVARYMSRQQGHGVAQAVLVGTIVPLLLKTDDNPGGYDPGSFDKQTAQLMEDRAQFFRSYFKTQYGVGLISHPVSEATLDWTWRMGMQAGLHPLLAARQAFGRTDFRPDLPAFDVPTLVIHGTSDSDAPIDGTGRSAAREITGARLIEYDGAPHGLVVTHKERLNEDLLSFLAQMTH